MNLRLKDLILKTTSSLIIGYMLMGNICISGMGLAKVIAEEIQNFDISIKDDTVRYVQYNQENYKGVILQEKIVVSENSDANNYAPIQRMEYQIELPRINNVLPERINILKANTELTKPNADNFNQNYDMNTGILNISYENNKDKDGNCYSEYKVNANDDFEIIYIYPQEAYLENSPEIDINTKIKTKVNYYSKNEIKTIEKSEESKRKQKENIGEIVSLDTTSISDIYKGYMYSNEENKTKYSTNYEIKSNLNILNSQITDEIKINLSKSDYIINQNKIVSTDTIIYHVNKINENDFNKILGENGYIEAYIANQKYATIRYLDADEQGNRKFATVYENEEKTNDEEAGRIVYQDNVKDVILKTSKPITEGSIEIQTQKSLKPIDNIKIKEINSVIEKNKIEVIKRDIIDQEKKDESGNLVYDENGNIQKQQIEKITQIETKENAGKIILKEPTTQMSMEINNNNISTLTNNKIALTIKMDDTNSSCNLFKAGKMEITLPQNLVNSKITNAQSLYTNGLQVTNAKIENGKVILDVQGKQTNYDIQNISGGVNIIVELELDIDDSTPTHEETLQATFNNTSVSQKVNIVSKEGVLLLNKIESNNQTINSVDESLKEIRIEKDQYNKTINQEVSIVNNLDQDITDVEILVKLCYQDNNVNSNFDTILKNIKVDSREVKLYYNDKANAEVNDTNWKEQLSDKVKTLKICPKENKLKKQEKIKINSVMEILGKLTYNQSSYIGMSIKYKYETKIEQQHSIIGILTEKNTAAKMLNESKEKGITANKNTINNESQSPIEFKQDIIAGNKVIENNENINEGQILKCKITVRNNTDSEIIKYKIKTTIENAVYYELQNTGVSYNQERSSAKKYAEANEGDNERIKEINIAPNSLVEYEYQYVVIKGKEYVKSTNELFNSNGTVLSSIERSNKIQKSKMQIVVEYGYNEENYVQGSLSAILKIKNYDTKELNNIHLQLNLSNQLIPKEFETENYDNISMEYDDENNTVTIDIKKIREEETEYIGIVFDVNVDYQKLYETVSINGKCTYDNITYLTNDFCKVAYQNKTNLKLNLYNNLNKKYIENGDEIVYTLKIENSGVLDLDDSIVKFKPGKGIRINSAYIIYENGKQEKINIEDGTEIIDEKININKIDDITVIYIVTVEDATKNIENEFSVTDTLYNTKKVTDTLIAKEKNNNDNKDDNNNNGNNGNNNKDNESDDNKKDDNNNINEEKYSISGVAWLDSNKDGKRDNDEVMLSEITVKAMNANTQVIRQTSTDKNGSYKFEGLEKGSYIIIFEFDTSKYTTTAYKKDNLSNLLNSDAILSNVTINGTSKKAGITDKIEISNENIENIDIGLIENATFDLSLDKQISSIQVINKQGTKTTEYNNKNFAKIDLVAKYMNNTNVIINYKFVIKNNGDVTGYVDKIVDNLPSGLEFSSELNKDWYKGSDGNLYTTSLNEIAIKPGETSEVELILTKKTTENTTGTFSNNAELSQISNIEAIEEKAEAKENNKSSADLVISIKTGSVIMYIGITIGCIAIIAAGAYIIKKKVINKEI